MMKIGKKKINKCYYQRNKLATCSSYVTTEMDRDYCRIWDVQRGGCFVFWPKNRELNLSITFICKSI